MATLEQSRPRHAVPRLRSFASAVALDELVSARPLTDAPVADEMLQDVLLDWAIEPGVSVAADLVSSALVAGKPEVAHQAARFLLEDQTAPAIARRMAALCLGEADPREISSGVWAVHAEEFKSLEQLAGRIHRTRVQLTRYPADAMLWTNLATLYVSLGQRRQGRRAIRAALSLAPQNRFVLRSAARILLHLEERDEAHALLLRADSLKSDAWMLSAEIAVAAANDGQSENVKLAQGLLERERFSPKDSSELAAELATIRALDGSTWAAKKLLRRAMKEPTENACAQAASLSRIPGMPAFEFPGTDSFEANAIVNRQLGKLRLSVLQTQHWLEDQPFSSRPAEMGSFVAGRIDRDDLALAFAEQGLKTNPDHPFLLNNFAFSAARCGELVRARESLRRIDRSMLGAPDRYVVIATEGLVAFREGDVKRGRNLYTEAVRAFREKKDIREAVALVYQALEELRAGTAEAPRVRSEALELGNKKLLRPEDQPLLKQLENFGKKLDPARTLSTETEGPSVSSAQATS